MSPDWSAKVEPVPYAKLGDPQSLNLYEYGGDSPLSHVDKNGHCFGVCIAIAVAVAVAAVATYEAYKHVKHMINQAEKTQRDEKQFMRDTIGVQLGASGANPHANLLKEQQQVTKDEVNTAKSEASAAVAADGAANAIQGAGEAATSGAESLTDPGNATDTATDASHDALGTGVESQNTSHPAPPPPPPPPPPHPVRHNPDDQ